jgi:hypothetical protein
MSYSFTVRAASKADVKQLVATELDKVVANQPSHEVDRAQAESAACAFVDALPDDDTKDVQVNVHGSIGWSGTWGVDHVVSHASIGVSASTVKREPAGA